MMATIVAVNKNTKSARFISFLRVGYRHTSYIHISALLLPFPKQFGKGTLMSRLSLSRANTILILILDKIPRTVRTVSRTKLSVPVYVGILLLQAPLRNEPDVPLATVASAVIVVSHDHSPCCGYRYTHISALLLPFPKQFGQQTCLSFIVGTESTSA